MYPNDNFYAILQRMQQSIEHQNNRIKMLEDMIDELRDNCNELSKTPKTNIEKIEYKFDQLKIERLDGTLNIGLTPNGGADVLDDFTVNGGNGMNPSNVPPEAIQSIQQNVQSYMQNGALQKLGELEKKYQYPLDDPYRHFILNDIQKQLDQRINYYVNQQTTRSPEGNVEQLVEDVSAKIKRDISNGMEAFLKNLPGRTDLK
ncbi:spore germination protein GerPC [Bacillus sp. N1-1]|jgi:spore germination protein PC|uniref:spore germination protein GerPC n=1 Tax=Bacillus sp. N1-1 TaxID=2682541 RepID=UPI0013167902|nr:spore germination protein GerPC [Bacillus sp. N1-1]QHA91470.1 spore gernimation protein GerPC [Bacillus sp. N1-1]